MDESILLKYVVWKRNHYSRLRRTYNTMLGTTPAVFILNISNRQKMKVYLQQNFTKRNAVRGYSCWRETISDQFFRKKWRASERIHMWVMWNTFVIVYKFNLFNNSVIRVYSICQKHKSTKSKREEKWNCYMGSTAQYFI